MSSSVSHSLADRIQVHSQQAAAHSRREDFHRDSLLQSPIHCSCDPQRWDQPQQTRNYPLPFHKRLGKERIQVSSHSSLPLSSQSVPSEPSCIHGHHCYGHPPSLVLQPPGEPHEVLLCGVFLPMDVLVCLPLILMRSSLDCGQEDETGSQDSEHCGD